MRSAQTQLYDKGTKKRKFLFVSEVKELIEAAEGSNRNSLRNSTMILMMFRHGLRVSEACGLTWHQVDFKNQTIYIDRSKDGISSFHHLEDDEIERLQQLKQIIDPNIEYIFQNERKSGKTHGRLDRTAVGKMLKALAIASGLEINVNPHMLRHACGFFLASQKVNLFDIQKHLGHKNAANTMIYIDVAGLPAGTIKWDAI